MPIGEHTISIRNGNTVKGSKPLTIKQGNSASFDNNAGSLTITNTSEKASVNLGSISNNTFDLTMSTPVDKDIIPPTVEIELSSEEPITGETLTAQITHTDSSGINLNNSKWIINQVSTEINGLEGYTWNKFNSNLETIDITQSTEGTYYLHIVSEDLEGNIIEKVEKIEIKQAKTMISFSVSSTTYTAEEGMTWEEWVNSDYNPTSVCRDDIKQFSVNGSDIFAFCYGGSISYNSSQNILSTEIIIANYQYTINQGGG